MMLERPQRCAKKPGMKKRTSRSSDWDEERPPARDGYEVATRAFMGIPVDLVPVIRAMIARRVS